MTDTPITTNGIELARAFYAEAVRPILDRRFPDLVHSACLLGYGSEVIGFDDARSRDHCWGPRVRVLLAPADIGSKAEIHEVMAHELPVTFMGFPTNYGPVTDAWHLVEVEHGPVDHRVEVFEVGEFFEAHLGFDPRRPITVRHWLSMPAQCLLEITAGAVFHDGLGELEPARARLAWYPADVWTYLLACQWQRISQEEAFVGRAGEAGDVLGSRVVAARLVRDVMRLWFLLERRYPPYSKWLGSAFTRLGPPAELTGALSIALGHGDAYTREAALAAAYEIAGARTNELGLAAPVDPTPRPYHSRPFPVIHAERFAAALRAAIGDEDLRRLPLTGGIDQVIDNTDVLSNAHISRRAFVWPPV